MPYLSNIINDHETPMNLRVHSPNEVITKLNLENGKFN